MDDTFQAVGRLLIQALPTFFLVIFLYVYLRQVFFAPLDRVLAERREATEGARMHAAEALSRANAQATAYEEQLRTARNEIYREQEEQRRLWREQQASQIAESRRAAEATVLSARSDLRVQAERAKSSLADETRILADRIAAAILQERPA